MEIQHSICNGIAIVRLGGRLDTANSDTLETALLAALTDETTQVVLDFQEVDYVSSGGLRVILLLAKRMTARKGALAMFGAGRSVEGVFRISGLSRIVPLFPDEAQAIGALTG
jgi:anti-anti-sigma factor